jgi:hypothetical protein
VPVAAYAAGPNREEGFAMIKAVRSYVKYGLSAFASVMFMVNC